MRKNNGFYAFILLLSGIFCLWSGISYASSSCDVSEIDQIVKDKVKSAVDKASQALGTYNSKAEAYISSCNPDIPTRSPSYWDSEMIRRAVLAGSSETALNDIQYTGILWSGETPTDTACESKRNAAQKALDEYNLLRMSAMDALNMSAFTVPKDCTCPDNSSEPECVAYLKYAEPEEGTSGDCESFATYLQELSACPLCPVFQIILETDNAVAHISWITLSKPLKTVVVTFFLVFLALETLKNIGNLAGAALGAYIKRILILGFNVSITLICLDNATYVYDYFISPVIKAGLDMGTAILGSANKGMDDCSISYGEFSTIAGGELDASLLSSIMRTVRCFGNSAAIMPAVGRGLMCYSFAVKAYEVPHLEMFLVGLIVYLGGLAIWLAFGFYLIDCSVQLGMVCALIPMCIACWPFKTTRTYTTKGFELIMNTFFNFALMGAVLLIGSEIVSSAIGGKSASFDDYIKAMNENNVSKLNDLSSLDGEALLILIACIILAFKLIGKVGSIADKFASGSGSNIGAKIGGAAAGAATSAAQTVGKVGGKAALAGGKAIADETGVTAGVNKVGTAMNGGIDKASAAVGSKIGLKRFQNQGPSTSEKDEKDGDKKDKDNNNPNGRPDGNNRNGGPDGNNRNG